ncbi:CPm [Rose leaf rosette-associated virus]|uniref:CPm n=1 Tax=Rose leaf rosette-associated virus TaxID=1543207 RepID=A0A088MG82_9CLOS|nr:CPm [Rose leaf rosette-associated virus]AIN39542.1 CPm [Rose leaf rosette-associated virus]
MSSALGDSKTLIPFVATPSDESAKTLAGAFDINSVEENLDERYTQAEVTEVLHRLETFLVTTYKIDTKHFAHHLAAIIKRAATLTTSTKVVYRDRVGISYKVEGVRYELNDMKVFGFIRAAFTTATNPNPLRKLCCTFQDLLLWMASERPEMFDSRRTTKLGAPKGKSYLATDFLSGNSKYNSERDRAIIIRCAEVALTAPQSVEHGELVSLRDIGRYI